MSRLSKRAPTSKAARKIAEARGSLRDVQQLAGDANFTTTQRYIEGNDLAKRKVLDLIQRTAERLQNPMRKLPIGHNFLVFETICFVEKALNVCLRPERTNAFLTTRDTLHHIIPFLAKK